MQCISCYATWPKRVVFLIMEDDKGEYCLCSKCWIERNKAELPVALPEPKKRRRRR